MANYYRIYFQTDNKQNDQKFNEDKIRGLERLNVDLQNRVEELQMDAMKTSDTNEVLQMELDIQKKVNELLGKENKELT